MSHLQPPLMKTVPALCSLALLCSLGLPAFVGGCSDASFSSPGGGSGTLIVDARVAATNRSINASAATGYETEIVVRLLAYDSWQPIFFRLVDQFLPTARSRPLRS